MPGDRRELSETAGRWEARLTALALTQLENNHTGTLHTFYAALELLRQEPPIIQAVIIADLAVGTAIGATLAARNTGLPVDEHVALLADGPPR